MAFFAHRNTVERMDLRSGRATNVLGGVMALVVFVVLAWVSLVANADKLHFMLQHGSDPYGYYQFLPATLGTHQWNALPWTHELENGNRLGLFPMGTAILQAPFFYASAAYCALSGQSVEGYAPPFARGQIIAAAFYAAMGGLLLFHALRRRYGSTASMLSALLVLTATNLFFYTVYDPGMSHAYAFFTMSAMVYLTFRMLDDPTGRTLVLLIITCGLLVLIRPLHAVALLFPLLFGSPLKEALGLRIGWISRFPLAVGVGVALTALLWTPQLIYWKAITGDLFVFTYGKKGEAFDWLHPHLVDVLLSHQNGWFIYSPLMAGVMLLLLWQAWKGTPGARLILVIWTIVWYTYSSWWCWWLGGSFGHRGFVEYGALLALPLAWGMEQLLGAARWRREVVLILLAWLVVVNIRLSASYQWPWEGPDWNWDRLEEVYIKAVLPG